MPLWQPVRFSFTLSSSRMTLWLTLTLMPTMRINEHMLRSFIRAAPPAHLSLHPEPPPELPLSFRPLVRSLGKRIRSGRCILSSLFGPRCESVIIAYPVTIKLLVVQGGYIGFHLYIYVGTAIEL